MRNSTKSSLNSGFALRMYRPEDKALIESWYRQGNLQAHVLGDRHFKDALPLLVNSNPGLRILVEGEGRAVGMLSAELRSTAKSVVLWIRLLLVDSSEQRKGYGRLALDRLNALFCINENPVRMLVSVDGRNEKGLAFWKAMHFKEVRRLAKGSSNARYFVHILVNERHKL